MYSETCNSEDSCTGNTIILNCRLCLVKREEEKLVNGKEWKKEKHTCSNLQLFKDDKLIQNQNKFNWSIDILNNKNIIIKYIVIKLILH